MTDRKGHCFDDNVELHPGSVDLPRGWYFVEVTEIYDAPTQETATTLNRVSARPDDAPTVLVDTTSPPAVGSSISPFPAPEQGFWNPYLEAQLNATNAGNWVLPSGYQQTDNASSISPFPAPEQDFLIPYLEAQEDATKAGNWVYPSDPQQTVNALSVNPSPAPEQGFVEPYSEAQLGAMNAGSWLPPSDPQQTDDFTSYPD